MAVMEEGHVMDLPHAGAVVCIGARGWTEFRYQIHVVGACPYKIPSTPMEPEICRVMSTPSVSFAPTPAVLSKQWDAGHDPTFAFARLQRDVCLVQRESTIAASVMVTILIFACSGRTDDRRSIGYPLSQHTRLSTRIRVHISLFSLGKRRSTRAQGA